jgi:hypothetical protein
VLPSSQPLEKRISFGISSKVETWEKFIEEQKRHQTLIAAQKTVTTPRSPGVKSGGDVGGADSATVSPMK